MKSLSAVFIMLLYFASCSGPQTENKVEATEPSAAATTNSPSEPITEGTTYVVQKDISTLKWMGSNKFTPKKHEGTIQLTEGSFQAASGQLLGGTFTADMTSIHSAGDEYTEGEKKAGFLIGHLKSPDFFDVEKFPTATFVITGIKPLEGNAEYNHEVTGNMTIKGITKEITFPAKVTVSAIDVQASTVFTIDRSQWEVKYGSESFFPDLVKDKLIRNEIELTLNLVAQVPAQ